MIPFALPSVADIRSASSLLPAQYDPKINNQAFETIIGKLIIDAGRFVQGSLIAAAGMAWPFYPEQVEAAMPGLDGAGEVTRQLEQATVVTKEEALARLWEDAGQLNDEYDEESDRKRAAADRELLNLTGTVRQIGARVTALDVEVAPEVAVEAALKGQSSSVTQVLVWG